MESLVENRLYADAVHLNNHKISTLTPEFQFSPFLAKLFLQENNSLTMLPPSFFQHMPVLRILDLSRTNIQSLPPSISKLCSLEKFILRDCSILIELPPEIGALNNLKLFDLEGTEIMYLPKEIGELRNLECLRVSLSANAYDHQDRNGIQHIVPRMTIRKLIKLKELSISVSPEAEWWEVELLEAIIGDLRFLPDLKTLKLYLPTAKVLQQFLRLERYKVPIYSSLQNYRFMAGHCEELPLSVQLDAEENFLKLEKCVKYMNGEGSTDEIMKLIRDARALYLRRHWTIEKLSMFDLRRLKYCLLMECNEMQTLVEQEDFYKHKTQSTSLGEDEVLGSLQYSSIHFLKKLQRISKGPIGRNSLSSLRILALHTCPELTSIFTECLFNNLQSLTEIIVEDCPKVTCLINLEEGSPWSNGPFFPNLRRISLLDLPELVSVSAGYCIAPQLETLLVFNCMKLNYLSEMEIPRDTMAIKGEIEWWDALKYGKLTWESVFVQLKRDGNLMDQLAEDTNSLQHFLELEMVPSLPGQVNQNMSTNTQEVMEYGQQLHIGNNTDLSNEARKMSNQVPCDDIYMWKKHLQNKSLDSRSRRKHTSVGLWRSNHKVKVCEGIDVEEALDDGYTWRKYGQKEILGAKYLRAYYRCSFKSIHGCNARKQVQRSDEDPSVFEVTYIGRHTCPTLLISSLQVNKNSSKDTKEDKKHVDQLQILHTVDVSNQTLKMPSQRILNCNKGTQSQYARTAFRMWKPPSPLSGKPDNKDTDCVFRAPNHTLASTKKKCRSADIAKWIQQMKGGPDIGDEVPYDYVRKYLQNESLNSKYPCHIKIVPQKCQVKVNKAIEVEKALDDGYSWQKYHEMSILGANYPSFKNPNRCHARKHVQRSTEDPSVFDVSYWSYHSCHTVLSNNCSSTATESACTTLRTRDSSTATESASIITDAHLELAKRQMKSISSTREATWTQQLKVSSDTGFDEPPDDGYVWRKYGQREILGSKHSISYFRRYQCNTKKRAQISDDDPSIWIVTYKGRHTCQMLSVSSGSTCESESALSILKSGDSSTTIESNLRSIKASGSSTTAESTSTITDGSLGLNFAKKMSGSASIQMWRQQMEEIQFPSLKSQLPSSYEPNMIISEEAENGSMNLSSSTKPVQNVKQCHPPVLKVKKGILGDRITELQQLVSPCGKVLMTPYIKQGTPLEPKQQDRKQDLRSLGLCLVSVPSTFPVTYQTTTDILSPAFEEPLDEPNAYKATESFPYAGM